MHEFTVRRAMPGEGEGIASLLSQTIQPEINELSIWCSPRLGDYLEDVLRKNAAAECKDLYVFNRYGEIGGVVCLRRQEGRVWVDMACVKPEFRGQLLGNRLFLFSVEEVAGAIGAALVGWEAAVGNLRQERWHARLGGVEQYRNGWWLALPEPGGGSEGHVGVCRGLMEADRQHAIWGFSHFEVETAAGRYQVGRLPGPYFRLVLPYAPRDRDLMATLRALDPTRRVFLLGPEKLESAEWERVAVSRCLLARLDKFISYLSSMVGLSNPMSCASTQEFREAV